MIQEEPCDVIIQFDEKHFDIVKKRFSTEASTYRVVDEKTYIVVNNMVLDNALYGWLVELGTGAKLLAPDKAEKSH